MLLLEPLKLALHEIHGCSACIRVYIGLLFGFNFSILLSLLSFYTIFSLFSLFLRWLFSRFFFLCNCFILRILDLVLICISLRLIIL